VEIKVKLAPQEQERSVDHGSIKANEQSRNCGVYDDCARKSFALSDDRIK
jgi:hypothetical protein